MEQQYILENFLDFNLKHIFECGQCFRWNKQEDGSYIGIVKQNVIRVKQDENKIIFHGNVNGNIKDICNDYFDLNTNYSKIKKNLSQIDENMRKSINFGYGLRILHQDIWETLISFIISANNNIPRIKKIIEKMSEKYGKKIYFERKNYYTFPTPEELSVASIEDLKSLGMGFRDKRIYETTKKILNKDLDIVALEDESTNVVKDKLQTLPGVGPKVADCVMLFSLKRYEVFPIDVWVRRVINELYIHEKDENKVKRLDIENLAKEKYGSFAGLAQQYLFYWRREKRVEK